MSASSTANIIIPEESSAEQEEIKKTSRMMLKVRDINALKENIHHGSFPANTMSKDVILSALKGPSEPKRSKTVASKSTQTSSQAEEDITSEEASIDYWKALAEKRRKSLAEALDENASLHITIAKLHTVIAKTNSLNKDLQDVVDTLTELLQEENTETKLQESNPVDDSGVVQGNDSDTEH
ncbi:AGAP000496-PA-like protein [Anopheles sinensis]|uniref:AGAP000496-PA-like protein n=1 Tax=Anopheles sinensis TaxID=74873 RepID=A0A084WFH4_ANOSI|nr:AGAP000496-PA-like protein [Anopheles sinensis]